ncbi:DUF6415 family natural product biosynthesis protein [Streptomyces sp. NPDC019224]|uniref:DUF6415 family natural product biosynthesis protein n=1 Tax=Streptomyces sp. NPDC019224 TaxID=3154484 RepID=UPI0033CD1E67
MFDDLNAAIGDQPPPVATTTELVTRLRGYLKHLSDIAVADVGCSPTAEMGLLVERGRPLREEPLPPDRQRAVGLARRLAFLTEDLVGALIEARYLKGPDE